MIHEEKIILSIVIPLYRAEKLIEMLVWELEKFSSSVVNIVKIEIVFVDDGSQDKTFDAVKNINTSHFYVKGIRLSKNFKSYIAILAGIRESTGDYITFLPQDLQESPDLVIRLLEEMKQGYDVVWAVRKSRSDPWFSKLLSSCFHKTMHSIWAEWPKTGADMFMINRSVANILLSMQEKNSHITGQILWMGFRQSRIFYDRLSRKVGKSGWSTLNKTKLAIDIITQFSYAPIRLCSAVGLITATLGFFYGIFIFFESLVFGNSVTGWSSIMLVMLLLGGINLIFLGIIGEYLWRTFDEVRNRPAYIVMETLEK
jgi:polyisoprenyl-phosphate glycosyltransferase